MSFTPTHTVSEKQSRGRLKVFLGYASGVGKTYAMLDSAQHHKNEGIDIVIGIIEPPVSNDNAARLHSLEAISPRAMETDQPDTPEMDVDAIIARRPQAVLVDELAHTNRPNSRHPRRYQDVEELLASGIDVYTTVNIQNLESLKDMIFQITGEAVTETVPDRLIDEADEIELVDISTEELLNRLRDESSAPITAARLTGLRQLALRKAASSVELQMHSILRSQPALGSWVVGERLMVCISTQENSEQLVRKAYQLAQELKAPWHVVHIETPRNQPLAHLDQTQLLKTLDLAESLGAQTQIVRGETVANALIEYARTHNITRLIIGKSSPQWPWQRSLAEQITSRSQVLDVYLVNTSPEAARPAAPPLKSRANVMKYVQSAILVILMTLIGIPLRTYIHPINLIMLYLAIVVFTAFTFGRGPALFTSALSMLAFDYFFIDPRLSLSVADSEYLITFAVFLTVALVISSLASMLREQVSAVQQRAAQTAAINALSRDLTVALTLDDILNAVTEHVSQTLSREVAIILPVDGVLQQRAATPGLQLSTNELNVARWVYDYGQPAGRGTATNPEYLTRFEPLKTARGVVGILVISPEATFQWLTPVQRQLLESFASLAALAIERSQLREEANRAQLLSVAEKLQTALLNSISHDLRTPLVSIQGVLEAMLEVEQNDGKTTWLDKATRLDMLDNAREETQRLNRLVENLLDMTRLESGALKISFDEGDIQDVIGSALAHMSDALRQNPVSVDLPPKLPLVMMDVVLIEQVLVNLLDNASKYSPAGAPIHIQVQQTDTEILLQIADAGIGIPSEDIDKIFDKFYRVQRAEGIKGTGLGLSICKGIIEAHKGRIWAQPRTEGGTIISFTLPIKQQDPQNE